MALDDSIDTEDDNLFYSSDLNLEEKDADQTVLDSLLLEIMQNNNNGTDLDKCQKYKSQISDICLAKFVQRSRFRPEEVAESSVNSIGETTDKPRPSSTLATPQQICCEFRMTYLRCLLTNINFACPVAEFNTLYDQVQGLSEICSRFFAKSSKKCRKRFRKRPAVVEANSTQPIVNSRK